DATVDLFEGCGPVVRQARRRRLRLRGEPAGVVAAWALRGRSRLVDRFVIFVGVIPRTRGGRRGGRRPRKQRAFGTATRHGWRVSVDGVPVGRRRGFMMRARRVVTAGRRRDRLLVRRLGGRRIVVQRCRRFGGLRLAG